MNIVSPESIGLSSDRLQRVTQFMEMALADKKTAGMSALVARQGQIAYLECRGVRDLASGRPLTLDTLFRIYSMTKPVTSTAVMMLVEQGKLRLFEPVSKYIPGFAGMKVLTAGGELVEAEREPTIHDLLTHTAGLIYGEFEDPPPADIYAEAGWLDSTISTAERLRRITTLPLLHQPGTVWHYSFATDVLGYIVGLIADRSLADFFAEEIFNPLGMYDTFFRVPSEKADRLATLYMHTPDKPFAIPDPTVTAVDDVLATAVQSGGGGLVSTIADYYRFARLLLNKGEYEGVRLLGRKTVEFMTMNHLPAAVLPMDLFGDPMPGMGFGLGFSVVMDLAATEQLESAGNYGWGGWANTNFWIDPQENLLAIFMTQIIPDPLVPLPFGEDFRTAVYQAVIT